MLLLIIVLLTFIDCGNSESTKNPTNSLEESSSPWTSRSYDTSSSSSQITKRTLLGVSIGAACLVLAVLLTCCIYFACAAGRRDQYVRDLASSGQGHGQHESQDLSSGPPRYSILVTVSGEVGAAGISLSQPRSAHLDTLSTPSVHGQPKKSKESLTEEPPPSYSSLFGIEHL